MTFSLHWFPGQARPLSRAQSRDLYAKHFITHTDDMRYLNPKSFFVYMTASRSHGVIYVGMTSDLPGRAWQHRERAFEGFTKKYWAGRLVYFEHHDDAQEAARREWLMKRWRRDWKIKLIELGNPTWADLYDEALRLHGFEP